MKKMFVMPAVLASAFSVVSCRPGPGKELEVVFAMKAPTKTTNNVDPSTDQYTYDGKNIFFIENDLKRIIIIAAQIVSDYLSLNKDKLINNDSMTENKDWIAFYQSSAWKKDFINSINYDFPVKKQYQRGFTYKFGSKEIEIKKEQNNEFIKYYIFNLLQKPESNSSFIIDLVPDSSDFKDKNTITKEGYFYNFMKIGSFKLTYYVKIQLIFAKNSDHKVYLEHKSIYKPFGEILNNDSSKVFTKTIYNLNIVSTTTLT